MDDMTVSDDELNAMKELLFREENKCSSAPVPRLVALSLANKKLVKEVSETPPTFRLTDIGKELLTPKGK